MLRITPDEYRTRLDRLKTSVRNAELDLFIVSAFDSIFYLTGAGYEPFERPFFLIIRPGQGTVAVDASAGSGSPENGAQHQTR